MKKIFLYKILESFQLIKDKQSSIGAIKKSCSKNMLQIYRRTPMPNCHFNKVFETFVLGFGHQFMLEKETNVLRFMQRYN